jgi:predicted  nucleic acid-binding Zn-ribbon protein
MEATARELHDLLRLAALDHAADQRGSEAHLEGREAAARRVPRRLLDRYLLLLKSRRAPVVVAIVGGACSGCHVRLPTMVESMARRSLAFHTCPHCQRMLYASDLLAADPPGEEGEPGRRAAASRAARRH